MEKTLNTSSIINWLQIIIVSVMLLVGTLVYLIDRLPEHTYFVFKSAVNISLFKTLPNLFGVIGNTLPSFVHVFAFILITAGMIACRKRGYLIICLSWLTLDVIFEFGQKFNAFFPSLVPAWFSRFPFLENTTNYFSRGTFDQADIASAMIGSALAYLVLIATMDERKLPL
ncbi:MAG: hypothetical protein JRJ37_08030 [Deltaproteobacteria bacterium]|nr:hypothetical protein [Deltaproteobacteria bacterium]